MSAQDVPSRLNIERIYRMLGDISVHLGTLESRLSLLAAEVARRQDYLTVKTYLELLSKDAAGYTAVFCIANAAGDFGFYYPYSGPLPANTTSILADINGAKYQLKQ
jgi:hypothetical protein